MSTNSTPQTRRFKSLNTLIADGLIDINATCYFTWNDITYTSTIVQHGGKYCFRAIRQSDSKEIIEKASTTFIRNLLALEQSTPIDGNKHMYINGKRISDYVLLESPVPPSSSTPSTSLNDYNNRITPTKDQSTLTNLITSFQHVAISPTGGNNATPTKTQTTLTSPNGTPNNNNNNSTPFSSPLAGTTRSPASVVAPTRKLMSQHGNQFINHDNMRNIKYEFKALDEQLQQQQIQQPLQPLQTTSDQVTTTTTETPASTSTATTISTPLPFETTTTATTTRREPIRIEYEESTIKASGIGRYFHFNCERYFNWSTKKPSTSVTSTTTTSSTTTNGTNENDIDIAEAIRRDGYVWEEQVMESLIQDKQKVHKPAKDEQTIPYEQVVKLLKEEKEDSFIVQAVLVAPPSFRQNIPNYINFSRSIPDFLKIRRIIGSEKRKLKILDAKSTSSVNFPQKVQLAYYYLWLKGIIESENITDLELDDFGAIYLKGNFIPVDFNILEPVRLLKRFIYGDKTSASKSQLVEILSAPLNESNWVLSELCDGCDYIKQCTDQAKKQLNHNIIPNLQVDTFKSILEEQQQEQASSAKNEIERFNNIQIETIRDPLLKAQYLRLKPRINGILSNTIIPSGYVDVMLPSSENVSIFISLVSDPIRQTLYKWTVLKVDSSVVSADTKLSPTIGYEFLEYKKQYHNGNDFRGLINLLYSIFLKESKEKSTLQTYIWDSMEKQYFFKLCYQLLKDIYDDEESRSGLIDVMGILLNNSNWINFNIDGGVYPQEPFSYSVDGKSQGSSSSSSPFIIIKDQIMKSLAIQVSPPYSLGEIAKNLLSLDDIPQSLDLNYIFRTFIKPQTNILEKENQVMNERVDYLFRLMNSLRYKLFDDIYQQRAPKFGLRKLIKYHNGLVNKLLYCFQFESMESYRTIRSQRSNPLNVNIYEGKYLILTRLKQAPNNDYHSFQADIIPQFFSAIQHKLDDTFSHFCLVPNTPDGLQFLSTFNDLTYQSQYGIRGMCDIADFKIESVTEHKNSYLFNTKISIKTAKNSTLLNDSNSDEFILFERYDNHYFSQYKWLVQGYDEMDKHGTTSNLLNLFNNPKEWTKEREDYQPFTQSFINTIEAFNQTSSPYPEQKLTLTKSQREIAINVVKRRLQLVRGPPGTGKTHFLALLVLLFFETIFRTNDGPNKVKNYTIAITALTHTAIDNALIRIAILKKEYETYTGQSLPLHIFKKESKPLADKELLEHGIKDHKQLEKPNSPRFIVIGATCWGINTLKIPIDFLIIDEASQLQTPIAALALNKAPRVVVCGDPKQLPPVLQGTYQSNTALSVDSTAHSARVHKSIFSCLKSLLVHHREPQPFLSLNENFRMTADLCQFSGILYGPSYRCAESGKKEFNIRTLQESKEWKDQLSRSTPLIQSLYDNFRSMHTILIDNAYHGNRRVEIEIVRQIYKFELDLFKRQMKPASKNADDIEEMFWKSKRLGVVTPLNMQRVDMQAMFTTEQDLSGCKYDFKPHVGTAEKMQGQEFDTVVVCYNGWSSSSGKSYDFVFNLNRLNVAFTRSKTRLILIVSEALLAPNQLVLNNPKTSKAYTYLLGYIEDSVVHKFIIQPSNIPQPTPNRNGGSGPNTPQTPTTSTFGPSTPITPSNNNNNNAPQTPIPILQQDFLNKLNLKE